MAPQEKSRNPKLTCGCFKWVLRILSRKEVSAHKQSQKTPKFISAADIYKPVESEINNFPFELNTSNIEILKISNHTDLSKLDIDLNDEKSVNSSYLTAKESICDFTDEKTKKFLEEMVELVNHSA